MTEVQWMDNVQLDVQSDIKRAKAEQVFVGFSGGLDSTFLLKQAVAAVGPNRVTAIHVNHGLSANSNAWQDHCEAVCQQLGCQFESAKVQVSSQGQGIEAAARLSRYQVFAERLPSQGLLLLGHHLDDQVETYFLRLFRGAGTQGLSGIQREMAREHYRILRPLLSLAREQIFAIATALQWSWIEDPSNEDQAFDRNFLRQSVLPLIETRWPAYRDKVIQAMNHIAQTPEQADSFNIQAELEHRLSHDQGLKLVQIDSFSESQLMSLLHAWLHSLGLQTPSQARLKSIVDNVIFARADAQPLVEIADGCVRRHGPALYWVKNQPIPAQAPELVVNQTVHWLGVGDVCLAETSERQVKIKKELPNLHWRLRQGQESMQPWGRSKSRDLKRLLQEYRVKPWLRDRLPLLYSADTLVAVADVLISNDHIAGEDEPGLRVSWQISD